ncbi:class III lanthionine synthetase LanKC [Streptomyces sp. ML-6]|uniref:class III lanthionine synthetase LanKC n=1 Tax=Streptomyces sp. ML-6 TaxID=2982693 RepID=UPI0024C0B6B6|nr:class III lanthionine synthetase LanKC [Streptomyces sp. ML-6]MDK0519568.1 class III lanthionine synthetase LanKC [Streptomyces sp. ML-6]
MPGIQETQLYCLADRRYYETPARLPDEDTRYPLDRAEPPAGWRRGTTGLWTALHPASAELPEQGWKIHISTVPEEAERTLADTARICLEQGVTFKFLRSSRALRLMSAKYMNRSSAGKFITVYPEDEPAFLKLLDALSKALEGRSGPYILSDLRIGNSPVYVRYGAFVELWCRDDEGERVRAMRHPSGELVPDTRGVAFRIPEWVTVPEPLRPHLAARAAAHDDDFPYVVTKALQFSSAGGIYLAEHRTTKQQVVLREARPHCGLDPAGHDAVTRLHREHRALTRLAGLDCVPEVYGVRTVWEHHFLIEEYIEGTTLFDEIVARFALARGERTPAELDAYSRWAQSVTDGLGRALDLIHARGLRFADVHPANVIIRPDGRVVLIDFEYATDLDDPDTPPAGAPGLQAPPDLNRNGAEADAYGLWAIWLHTLMPLMEVADHDRGKALTLERWARARYRLGPDAGPPRPAVLAHGLPDDSGEPTVDALLRGPAPDWPGIRERLVAGIRVGATPDRTDRLYPGDLTGFTTGGACAAHGAAGVLYALDRLGAPVPDEHVDWLARTALRRSPDAPGGLFDGLPGIALVLSRLGRREEGRELLDRALRAPASASADLLTGRAGTALAALRFASDGNGDDGTPDQELLDRAVRTAWELDSLVRGEDIDGRLTAPHSAGLLTGLCGAALLQLELYGHTGEDWLLDAAGAALTREAGHCVLMPGGSVQVKDGKRHLLYLDQGSSGVALLAQRYLAHREDPALAGLLPGIGQGCVLEFVREPGLFRGRAGLVATAHQLSARRLAGGEPDPEVLDSVRNLSWHLVAEEDRLLVPGARLRRFSADLATGAAGLLLALHTVFAAPDERPDLLDVLTLG